MLNSTKIRKEIEKTSDKIKQLENVVEQINIERIEERKKTKAAGAMSDKLSKMIVTYAKKEDEIYKKIGFYKLCKTIYINNFKLAALNETLSIICEEMNKFKGKQHGEITSKKIRDAIKERCGVYFYCSKKSYGGEYISISKPGDFDRIEFTRKSGQMIDDTNKIQETAPDEFQACYMSNEFVENVPERAEKIIKKYSEVVAKDQELRKLIAEYNELNKNDSIFDQNNFCPNKF